MVPMASSFTETSCSPPASTEGAAQALWKIRAPSFKRRKPGKLARPAGRGRLAMNSDTSCRPIRFEEPLEEIRFPEMFMDPHARDNLETRKKSDVILWHTSIPQRICTLKNNVTLPKKSVICILIKDKSRGRLTL